MDRGKKAALCCFAAALGAMALTLAAAAWGVRAGTVLLADQEALTQAVERTMTCAHDADWAGLERTLWGTPDLGDGPETAQDAQGLIWRAYFESLQYDLEGPFYVSGNLPAVDVAVTCLDIDALTEALAGSVPAMLEEQAAQAADMAQVYDEDHRYRQDFVREVLAQAVSQALEQMPTTQRTLTLRLDRQDGQWRVVPEQDLTDFLTGFVTGE